MTNRILLGGCAPEPLISYLKALGVFRIVAEQLDAGVRGAWSTGGFVLETGTTESDLVAFFRDAYSPTPIVAPWNGGSGFYPSTSSDALDAIAASDSARLADYREAIAAAKALIASLPDGLNAESKDLLLQACRSGLSDRAVEWIDAAYVLGDEKTSYPPLLGTGGNDGRLDFTNNFMLRIVAALPEFAEGPRAARSRALGERQLHAALFGGAAELLSVAAGQFFPAGAGGANASEGLSGGAFVNPWDFILGIEGTLTFASATVRQLAAGARSKASFPFTVQNSFVGYGSAAEAEKVRAEIWLPVWSRPATAREIAYVFGKGRARHERRGGRAPRTGFDFARAVASLGIDRGIDAFHRYGFLERNGQAYLATPLGRVEVRERPEATLVVEADRWIEELRRATRDAAKTPPRMVRARRDVEEAVFALCTQGGRDRLRAVLVALGAAEAEVARGPRMRSEHPNLPPLAGLSRRWVEACDDASPEFAIAAALASIAGKNGRAPLRANVEPVEIDKGRLVWTNDDLARVWGAGSLAENLTSVLHRRCVDASSAEISHPDIGGACPAPLPAVAAFLNGETDDDRIERLLRGLLLVDWSGAGGQPARGGVDAALPRAYALLKLLFLPGGRLPSGRWSSKPEESTTIVHEPSIVPMLRASRPGEAIDLAARRLRVSGLVPMSADLFWPDDLGARMAAALLIPVSRGSAAALARLVLRPTSPQEDEE